jgi:hypothetical protein
MFTGSMSNGEMKEGYDRLIATAKNKDSNAKEVKLCYVTVRLTLPWSSFDLLRVCGSTAREDRKEQEIHVNNENHVRGRETW